MSFAIWAELLKAPLKVPTKVSAVIVPLALILPEAVIWPTPDPEIDNVPVNLWVSSVVFPNIVEPLWKIIDEEINSVWNSCAVIVSVTIKEPVICASPTLIPSLLNVWLAATISVAIEALIDVNDPEISSAICPDEESIPSPISDADWWVNIPVASS